MLSKETFNVIPGRAPDGETKKRPLSIVSQIEVSSTQRKARPERFVELSSDDGEDEQIALTNAPFTQPPTENQQNNANTAPQEPSNKPDVVVIEPPNDIDPAVTTKEKSVSQMFELATAGYFPRREFSVKGHKKLYTPITHFFLCKDVFESIGESAEFKCKIKNCVYHCSLGDLTNLNKHLKSHPETAQGYRSYIFATTKRKTSLSQFYQCAPKLIVIR